MSGNVTGGKAEVNIFLIAGEHSGDALGGKLMAALARSSARASTFSGVGGEAMENEGLVSQFPLSDVAVMGPLSILRRLPRIMARVYGTVEAPSPPSRTSSSSSTPRVHAPHRQAHPQAPPDHSHHRLREPERLGVAAGPRRARCAPMSITFWALLPFEPEAHERLGGPPCTYVGHPLIERPIG